MEKDYVAENANRGVLSTSFKGKAQIVERELVVLSQTSAELFERHEDELFSAMSAYGDKIKQL